MNPSRISTAVVRYNSLDAMKACWGVVSGDGTDVWRRTLLATFGNSEGLKTYLIMHEFEPQDLCTDRDICVRAVQGVV